MEQDTGLIEARDAALSLDFSWTGLRKPQANCTWNSRGEPIQALRGPAKFATLQDFWRGEEGKLVETDVGTFTRWHLPPGVAPEASPGEVEFSHVVANLVHLFGIESTKEGVRDALPFQGVRFPSGAVFAELIEQAAIAGIPVNLQGATVVGRVSLGGVFADSPLRIDGMWFLGTLELAQSRFEEISARNTRFQDRLILSDVAAGTVAFVGARVAQPAGIYDCRFERFGCSHARFDSLWFQNCSFEGNLDLSNSELGDATIKYCHLNQLDLKECRVASKLWVLQNDIKSIYACRLSCGDLYLDAREGNERVWVNSADINGQFRLAAGMSTKELNVEGSVFRSGADFSTLETVRSMFSRAEFKGRIDFVAATFNGPAAFDHVIWPIEARNYASAFRDARFRDAADFTGKDLTIIAAFNEAHFQRPPLINLDEGKAGDKHFRSMLRSAADAAKAAGSEPGRDPRETYYGALEGGSRVLKQAMESRRARSLEQRLYRYELIARRHRPSISAWERSLSWLYGASSNYGESSLRPLVILIALTALLGLIYAAWAAAVGGGSVGDFLPQGLSLSGRNVFRPFEVWSLQKAPSPQLERILLGNEGYSSLLTRIVSSAQTFASFVLTFLVALALKRKFQLG